MLKEIKDILNKQLLRQKPTSEQFDAFLHALRNLKASIQPNETEEHNKSYIETFLKESFYGKTNLVNTAGSIDCAIYQKNEATSSIEVIIETKSPNNQSEFPSVHNLNCKAMQELVLYFMREWDKKNYTLKHLIITNGYEWFIIDAKEFKRYFVDDKKFKDEYEKYANHGTLFSETKDFYGLIAKPKIDKVKQDIDFAYVDIRTLHSDSAKLKFYRILQPAHLLKEVKFTDSNKLNTAFYNELLHIIGLEEHKIDGKSVIERKPAARRNINSLLESTIYQLEDYGVTSETAQFDIALNLVITWINRVLFLKLLESQLISYHSNKQADEYCFLAPQYIKDYDELNELFFKVLAIPTKNRPPQVKEKFRNIPYLNSSLFELTDNEDKYFRITGLKSGTIPLFSQTVLKDQNGHHMKLELETLEYLFRFLDAYDFGSDQLDSITKSENKTLISASVLGLIFEKINGYKDGSFFTPAFITQYMCREAIERTVIHKFNEHFGWDCKNLTDIHNQDFDKQEGLALLDSITICDPAVGSGHFLVSALNRLIAVRTELGLLQDENGKRLKNYSISIDNDELIILDEDGELFHYNPNNTESQRVQKTLFELKRRIIENNLFGADINSNSVNICRLRLWIELLKNAYYRDDTHELETLPNIDINIKCGDSLKNKYPIAVGEPVVNDNDLQKYIIAYKQAVVEYKQTSDKKQKQAVKDIIEQIKYRIQFSGDTQLDIFDKARNKTVLSNSSYAHSLEWMIEYPEVLDEAGKFAGFDIIIGNPPYIQLQADGGKLADLYKPSKGDSRNNYKTYARTGDIYCLFYERGYQLLKPNGILCFITSNKWMRSGYGEKTREFLSSQMTPDILIDFAGIKVFENATVDTNILLVTKAVNAQRKCTAVSCQNAKIDDIKNLSDYVQSHSDKIDFNTSDSWVIMSEIEQSIKGKIEAVGIPLRDWNIQINYGIKTGYNDAFVITTEKRDEILANCLDEAERERTSEIIRPILRGRDIKRYGYDWDGLWLINTHNGVKEKYSPINIEDYPSIKQY
ncbi:MAG: class I SAM-dependent DNA methyltransferase, partial [Paludibacteraceae bacterium]|nr:class I SAM-dependent DNA methyltransferase [Paludibacteraceae bacterium]